MGYSSGSPAVVPMKHHLVETHDKTMAKVITRGGEPDYLRLPTSDLVGITRMCRA